MFHTFRVVAFCTMLFLAACSTPSSHTAVTPETDGELVASRSEAASEPAAAAAAGDDPIVCKRVVQTGTRVAQRICSRQSELDAKQRDAQEMLGEVQKRGVLVNETKQ